MVTPRKTGGRTRAIRPFTRFPVADGRAVTGLGPALGAMLGAALVAAVGIGCAGEARRTTEPDRVDPPEVYAEAVEHVRAYLRGMMDIHGLPAVSVALVDDQDVVWAEGFGLARPSDSIPATANTIYRVGSVSKLFTDLAVMQLVERDQLDLDAPIQDYLPDFGPENPWGVPITLRQLMSHRAGLVREPPVGNYFEDTEPTIGATVRSLANTALVYEPETRTKYSNAGIAAVGYVLEEMQGEDFAGYLQRSVLAPWGMRSTSFEPNETVRERLASAVMWTLDHREFPAPTFELGMAPAGSMYSTVLDLGRFMSALFAGGAGPGGTVVSQETLETMWTPQFAEAGATTGYGIGFGIGELDGRREVGHGGAIYGFATELAALPDERLGVVVVTSMDFANNVAGRIATMALRSALAARDGAELPEYALSVPIDPSLAERLEGRYRRADGSASFDLLERAERLYLDPVAGGARMEIRVVGDTLVADDVVGTGPRYLPTDVGVRTPGGEEFVRTGFARPRPPPDRWRDLIGEYGWDHNTLYVLEKDGQLNALIEWAFRYPLEEEGPDRFRFPERGLYDGESLVFERDPDGSVVRVVLAGSVVFERREIDGEGDETFKIEPVRPVDDLRTEALAAAPPASLTVGREPELTELVTLDPTVQLDIRYASTNNFMDAVFYDEPRAFLQRPAAQALVRAQRTLAEHGYGLLVHDGYRPWYVTKMFWDATPEEQKLFVADPAGGSRHNRGSAVDLTLYDLSTGEPADMVSGYDEFSPRAFPDYPGGTDRQRWLRELLREAMEDEGFDVYEWEWWHFDHQTWREYPVLNLRFDELAGPGEAE